VGLYFNRRFANAGPLPEVRVQPNELARETPYLKSNIEFTRKAFSLDAIQETSYPALSDLTAEVIARIKTPIQNIRLWDYPPVASDVSASPGDTALLSVYGVDVEPLPLAGWLSPGDAFGPRARRGASCRKPKPGSTRSCNSRMVTAWS